MLHSTQRSRDKLSTEGRLRPNTEPTYLLLRRQTVNGGLLDHFDNYFAEIASVRKYQTRLASLQNYYLPRMKTSLGQLSLKFIGPKIWSNIPENLKSSSPYTFGKKYKKVLLSCQTSC